jgi:hypothetical protein
MVRTWEVAVVCGWALQQPDKIRSCVEASLGGTRLRPEVDGNGVAHGVR